MNRKMLTLSERPRAIENFVGNQGWLNLIQDNLKSDTMPHLILLYGTNGVGKSALAEYIALSLSCKNKLENGNPCCECKECQSILKSDFNNNLVKSFDLGQKLKDNEIKDVVKEIFDFESVSGRSVFILDEMQAVKPEQQSEFKAKLTKVPDDVYIIMCTDDIGKVVPAVRNRFTEVHLTNPTKAEAEEFVKKLAFKLELGYSDAKIIKLFAKGCKYNPRAIVTNLEMFRSVGNIAEDSVKIMFNIGKTSAYTVWKNVCSNEMDLGEFIDYIKNVESEDNLVRVYHDFQYACVDYVGRTVTNLSDIEMGTLKELKSITSNPLYAKMLKVVKEPVSTDAEALINFTRCKIIMTLSKPTTERIVNNVKEVKQEKTLSSNFARKEH